MTSPPNKRKSGTTEPQSTQKTQGRQSKNMIRIAICDDEEIMSRTIQRYLECYLSAKEYEYRIDIFSSGKDFVEQGIHMLKYQIVFLDIKMGDMDGVSTAKMIRAVSDEIYIAFLTAYADYSLDGYKVGAIRYIIKNHINTEQLIYECMDAILKKMNQVEKTQLFHFLEGDMLLSPHRILFVESKLHKLEFSVMEETLKVYHMNETLDKWEKFFQNNDFIRSHQSYLVNLRHIEKMGKNCLILTNKQELPVPRVRYNYVNEALIMYKGAI